ARPSLWPGRAVTKIGPESRSQERSVLTTWNWTFDRSVRTEPRTPVTSSRVVASRTSSSTRSYRASVRTISAYTHLIGANFPGQSDLRGGKASQVAGCVDHSAGIRQPGAVRVIRYMV